MKKFLVVSVAALLLVSACATVEKPEVAVVQENKPQVSKVLTEEAPKRFLKRKVAIARFSNETTYGQSFFLDKNNDRVGKQAMDILSAKLAATHKFILLERSDIDKINAELKRGNISNLNITANYLIIGSVEQFGRKAVSKVGIFSRAKKQEAYAKVDIRLVDVQTGEIIYSEEADGEAFSEAGSVFGMGARTGYDSTLNDKAISAAISKVVNKIVEHLLDKPWRSYVLSREDGGEYIIAGGKSQGIRVDDTFGVYRRGRRVRNPQTGMLIELPGELIAKIKVVAFAGNAPENEISLCKVVGGKMPVNNFAELYVQALKKL